TLPPAEAVINPKRLPADHPLRELPGVGVAYKLAEGLAAARNRPDLPGTLLDLVALGIVADLAVQTADTRYLLQRGLETLRRTERPGLLALIELSNLRRETLTAEHIGFWLGPRLNALGRLGDANQAVELLTTSDRGRARILAAQLDALNERRKLLVDRTVVQALSLLADTPSLAEYNAIVLAAAEWHPGVIGIACSRLVEQFYRPVILLSLREGRAHGSARSIPGCDIHRAIQTQAHLLERFGGHPMAAGLSMHPRHLDAFRRGLSDALRDCVARAERRLAVDAVVPLSALNFDLLATVQKLAPFGPGNPPVTLAVREVSVQEAAVFGRTRAHRRLTIADRTGNTAQVIWWNSAESPVPEGTFDLALRIAPDTYRGGEAVQVVWVDARLREAPSPPPRREVVDLRAEADVRFLLSEADALFWASDPLSGVRRLTSLGEHIEAGGKLVIWQAPPGQDVLQETLAALQPAVVWLVARPSPLDSFPAFVRHLMGLVKFALSRYGGRLAIADLSAAMVHREATVRLGLAWLASRGKLEVVARDEETWVVRAADAPPRPDAADLQTALQELLRETAAYRAFARSARLAALGIDD
ncbi:MAG: hypothetical protein D6796_12775, partial [Caldilineae bacterium]